MPVRDTELYVKAEGNGPPLAFVHGMCGDAEVWTDQVRRLSDRFTCLAYDRRGHSRSPAGARDQSYATHADDAAALIETLGLRGCTLVGSSGGAYVGFEVLRRHPGVVGAAVLSEPPLFPLDPAAGAALKRDVAPAVDAAVASRGPRAAVDAFFEVVCPGLWEAIDERRRDRYRDNAPMLLPALTEPADPVDAATLAAIDVPVLVLTGSESHPALRTIAARLASGLINASLVELPGSGHVTYAEQPAAFEAAVRAFADSLGPRPRG
ncbi:MAG TPA: alpha/beta hydrolase [Intrasporangium sp.]|uniref:alpha/beta fold hydrolase n=1 Tax=Intrasporangium sp. TaxID=1925024 RepID=UPI002D79013D|nr:alpha/beta hydrolase [Intrasporangium sp.]HET7397947.1 alpha/beta hydrolase [Intrasporangium sp.]